jgi:hypothetical protein
MFFEILLQVLVLTVIRALFDGPSGDGGVDCSA